MSNNERLEYLKKYYANQKFKVEVPVHVTENYKGKIYHYFNGKRNGYEFRHGFAFVDRKDIHLFENQHYIIHQEGEN